MSNQPERSPLGKTSAYKTGYDPHLLSPILRQGKCDEIGLATGTSLPFFDMDLRNLYELSWLNLRDKPQVALGTAIVLTDLPDIVELKSFKPYLDSFSQTKVVLHEML